MRSAAPRTTRQIRHAARLAELRPHLTLVARALSGEPLEIRDAEHAGGFVGEVLYLPRRISIATTLAENVNAYLYRVAYTVTSRQLGLTLAADDAQTRLFRSSAPCWPSRNAAGLRSNLTNDPLPTGAIISPAPGSRPPLPALETTPPAWKR